MSNGQNQDQSMFSNAILKWIDDRFPLSSLIREHATEYYASKNFNIWYIFGVLSLVVLVIQLVTGIFLTMSYKPSAKEAFDSVEYIMRSVEWGWLIRYMHSTGSSFFFIVVYLHMFICFFIVPAEQSSVGDYETGSVRVCVCVCMSVCVSVCDALERRV